MRSGLIAAVLMIVVQVPVWACSAEKSATKNTNLQNAEQIVVASSASPMAACRTNADCLANHSCVRGQCEWNGGGNRCNGPADCPVGSTCDNGVCR